MTLHSWWSVWNLFMFFWYFTFILSISSFFALLLFFGSNVEFAIAYVPWKSQDVIWNTRKWNRIPPPHDRTEQALFINDVTLWIKRVKPFYLFMVVWLWSCHFVDWTLSQRKTHFFPQLQCRSLEGQAGFTVFFLCYRNYCLFDLGFKSESYGVWLWSTLFFDWTL